VAGSGGANPGDCRQVTWHKHPWFGTPFLRVGTLLAEIVSLAYDVVGLLSLQQLFFQTPVKELWRSFAMSKLIVAVLGVMLLSTVQAAFADDYDACRNKCSQKRSECVSRINSPNDIEVQDQTEACSAAESACHDDCNDLKNVPPPAPEETAAPEPKKDDTNSGGIKTYQFQ
jgi:hypothetical protein